MPIAHTLWASALVASLAGSLWLHLGRFQLQRELSRAETTLATERAERERERADAAVALAAAADQARQTEAQWRTRHQEVQDHARRQVQAAVADGARARDAADGLRQRADALAARCAGPSPANAAIGAEPANRGETASGSAAVLADVLREVAHMAVELAAVADARGVAGAACERAYDALTPPRKP